jgi:hypothetical protein
MLAALNCSDDRARLPDDEVGLREHDIVVAVLSDDVPHARLEPSEFILLDSPDVFEGC